MSSVLYDLAVRISSNAAALKKGLKDAKKNTDKFEKGVKKKNKSISNSFKRIGTAIAGAFAVRQMSRMIDNTTRLNQELERNAHNLSISVERLQELNYAASQAGVGSEAMRDGLKELSMRADEFAKTASGPAAEAFQRLGISKEELQQVKGNTDALFSMVTESFSQLKNAAAKQRIADELFGGTAAEQMVTMLSKGIDEINKKGKEARERGLIIDAEEIRRSAEFQKQLKQLSDTWKALQTQLINEAAPVLTDIGERLAKLMQFVQENSDAIKNWAKTIGTAVVAFTGLRILKNGYEWISNITVGWKALNTAMKANVIMAIASAVLALVQYLIRAWKESAKFRAIIKWLWESVKYYFSFVVGYIKWAAETTYNAWKTYFTAIVDMAKTVWKSIKAAFQKGKSVKEVFSEGIKGIKDDIVKFGKDTGESWKKSFTKKSRPKFEDILEHEKIIQDVKDAGKKGGEKYKESFNDAVAASRGEGTILEKASPLRESVNVSIDSLKDMSKQIRKTREEAPLFRDALVNVFEGMQDAITNALDSSKNTLQAFWKFFKQMIQGMIIKLISAIITTLALAAALSLIFGTSFGTSLTGAGEMLGFRKYTDALGGTTLKGAPDAFKNIVGGSFANGGMVTGETLALVGDYPGVQSNPEWMLRDDQLQGVIRKATNQNSIGGKVDFRIEYDALVGVLNTGKNKNDAF